MANVYTYTEISYHASDETKINFTVEFISDGNTGVTTINAPKKTVKEIVDSGTKYIGLAKDLRNNALIAVSKISNLIPEEDKIKIHYKINDTLLVEHSNLKLEEENPMIILLIKILPL